MIGSGSNAAADSLYEIFFEIEDDLCTRYHGLTPFQVRREKAGEVFLLVKRVNRRYNREHGYKLHDQVWIDKRGNTHIRRPAQNDNWY